MKFRAIAIVATATALSLSAAGTAAAKVTATRPVQLTGTQLAAALLPASDFPADYTRPKPPVDSGNRLENGPARYHLATMSCSSFVNHFEGGGFGETSFAANGYGHSIASGIADSAYALQVYQFRTSSVAASSFHGLRAIFGRCPSFIFPAGSLTMHVSTAAPVDGYRVFQAVTSGMSGFIKVHLDVLYAVAGTDVFMIFYLSDVPPTGPAPRSLMGKLIPRVQALR